MIWKKVLNLKGIDSKEKKSMITGDITNQGIRMTSIHSYVSECQHCILHLSIIHFKD